MPQLKEEWSDKNGSLTAADVTYGSNRKVWWKGACGHEWEATVKNRVNGAGCPYCAHRKCLPGFNDFKSQRKKTSREWSSRNVPLKPSDFMVSSNRKVWWKCSMCGQEWQARISDRAAGSGCPYCAGAVLMPGANDLETQYPELMEDWSMENIEIDPAMVSPLSRENVLWKCHECGYEWRAVIATRVRGQKCPLCAGRVLIDGYNDLLTNEPDLAGEWHPYKNCDCSPETVIYTSDRLVWWKGTCGHSWRARVSDRRNGSGCPVCEHNRRKNRNKEIILRFAKEHHIVCELDDDTEIGLPFDLWFPKQRIGVVFPELHPDTRKEQLRAKVRETLCMHAGIHLLKGQDAVEYFQQGKWKTGLSDGTGENEGSDES